MPQFITIQMNLRIEPILRGDMYEDPLNKILTQNSIGEVVGGGSALSEAGEIESCDIEVQVQSSDDQTVNIVKSSLEGIGVPKGSKIIIEDTKSEIEIGTLEGLAIYLNGTDLDDEIYANSDVNFVCDELMRLTEGVGRVINHWQGPTETAFYMYGKSFSQIKDNIADLVNNYPLCQKCRIVQIA